jgi:oxygen-independent coproporphyrinogen-3 oxidase
MTTPQQESAGNMVENALIPNFPWDRVLEESDLSTLRGFVFQYPPFPALDTTTSEIVNQPKDAALYLHLPFCSYHCAFCYYAVSVGRGAEDIERYLQTTEREMDMLVDEGQASAHQVRTLFFGGGTPTYLGAGELKRIATSIGKRFDLSNLVEFTVEGDPTTVTRDKIEVLRSVGVNRISLGVQSFSTETNLLNDRKHSREDALRAIDAVRAGGIDNINLDFICGLVGETEEGWNATIDELLQIRPEHVTIYLLSLRPQTVSHARVCKGTDSPGETQRVAMYRHAREGLLEAGYLQTTPNCFVREACYEQKHQLHAWSSLPLIGLGNSAYSYVDDCVKQNCRSIQTYEKSIAEGRSPIALGQRLTALEQMIRYCVLRLKQLFILRDDFRARFGFDLEEVLGDAVARLTQLGLAVVDKQEVRLTEKGIVYADDACRLFYSAQTRLNLHTENSQKRLVDSLI